LGSIDPNRPRAAAIRAALGDGFEVVLQPGAMNRASAMMLVSGDRRLMLYYATLSDAYNHNQLTITGVSPMEPGEYSWITGPSIKVTASRPAEHIAKDITRRLMPDYLEYLARQNKRKAQNEANKAKLSAEAERIAALIPTSELTPAYGSPTSAL
jgi:hypothetical protein